MTPSRESFTQPWCDFFDKSALVSQGALKRDTKKGQRHSLKEEKDKKWIPSLIMQETETRVKIKLGDTRAH